MISIIICSRNIDISDDLKSNILTKIGIEYELIVIDNSENRYSIFSAYNEGIKRAKYPYLCFMHEDILYEVKDWGFKVIDYFEDEKVGMIGVAGTPYYPKLPGNYWTSGIYSGKVTHSVKGEQNQTIASWIHDTTNPNEVLMLDGVWFCIPKKLFDFISFDDKKYSGFHFYDLDISMQVKRLGYRILTVFDIDIVHFSKGSINKEWVSGSFVFFKKWKKYFPYTSLIPLSKNQIKQIHKKTFDEVFWVINETKSPEKYLFHLLYYYLISDFSAFFKKHTYRCLKSIIKSSLFDTIRIF